MEKFTTHLNQWINTLETEDVVPYLTKTVIEGSFKHYLKEGHYFKVNNEVLGLFLSTKPTVCFKALRLPFSSIFMDLQLPLGEGEVIEGVLLNQSGICDLDNGYLEDHHDMMYDEEYCNMPKEYSKLSIKEKKLCRESAIEIGRASCRERV